MAKLFEAEEYEQQRIEEEEELQAKMNLESEKKNEPDVKEDMTHKVYLKKRKKKKKRGPKKKQKIKKIEQQTIPEETMDLQQQEKAETGSQSLENEEVIDSETDLEVKKQTVEGK